MPDSLHPVLRRVYAGRGITSAEALSLDLKSLLSPDGLFGVARACEVLQAALQQQKKILVVGDYDADGATGTALAVSALKAFGAQHVSYLVPSRFSQGYGLSAALSEIAAQQGAQLLITVDNGIASVSGVAKAQALGMQVLITDHHLAGPELPAADAIVNPNQPGCSFASKSLSGVGTVFYVLSALRTRLRESGWFRDRAEPNLAEFLDLVAIGTVADVVRLDHNNRILVAAGLARIRAQRARPGVQALLQLAGRDARYATAADLGFTIGPRLNAAGRLEDMALGIECLLSPDTATALSRASRLDQLNRERRGIETQMRDEALALVEDIRSEQVGVSLFDPTWHEGVVGLVASRIKDKLHRPTIAFARAQEAGALKGSARSISGLHVRDALAAVDARHPGLIARFGGHAMAAGLTLPEADLATFTASFDQVCRQMLAPEDLAAVLETDGELATDELNLDTAQVLENAGPWGQGFPEPLFEGQFNIRSWKKVGEHHRRFVLADASGASVEAIWFGSSELPLPSATDRWVYRLGVDRFRAAPKPMLHIQGVHPSSEAFQAVQNGIKRVPKK